MAPDPPSEHVK